MKEFNFKVDFWLTLVIELFIGVMIGGMLWWGKKMNKELYD